MLIDRRIFLKTVFSVMGGLCASCIGKSTQAVNYVLHPQITPDFNSTEVIPTVTQVATKVFMPTVMKSGTPSNGLIIADHSVVDRYTVIPQVYIDEVKKLWLNIPGESHSMGYLKGLRILSDQDSRFTVSISDTPEPPSTEALRVCKAKWGDYDHATGWCPDSGEEDWYTNDLAIQRTKAHLLYCHNQQYDLGAMGFIWCWDMSWENGPDGGVDPVYQVRWAGRSEYGPDDNWIWGLDADDYTLTNNRVCMDTYLQATQEYINFCKNNSIKTKVFFTTGPVDEECSDSCNTGEAGYQRHIKHEYIRDFIKASSDRILFDYADILSWNDAGNQTLVSWDDYSGTKRYYPIIHPDNLVNNYWGDSSGHIGEVGGVRLAKAMWWMLARLAGWDGL